MIHQGKMKVNIAAGIYLLKVNNRNSRIYFTSCSNVFIVNFEEVIAGWNIYNFHYSKSFPLWIVLVNVTKSAGNFFCTVF